MKYLWTVLGSGSIRLLFFVGVGSLMSQGVMPYARSRNFIALFSCCNALGVAFSISFL